MRSAERVKHSTVVRAADFELPAFKRHMAGMHCLDEKFKHRKAWELAFVAEAYYAHERAYVMHPRALGFGVGREPLTSWLANQGADVIASDYLGDDSIWKGSEQHAASVESLFDARIVSREVFDRRVRFENIDMRDLQGGMDSPILTGTQDFIWSCSSLEHLGSRAAGVKFFGESLDYLRSGGVAVHITELALGTEDENALESRDLSFYEVSDLWKFRGAAVLHGCELMPFDIKPGDTPEDEFVDTEPYYGGLSHLRLRVGPVITTSIALVAVREVAK